MIPGQIKTSLRALAMVVGTTLVVGVSGAHAAAPVRLALASQFGREVNLTETIKGAGAALEDVCTVQSKDECQPAHESNAPGGFQFVESVAGAPGGNIYVVDRQNKRIQELTATGQFVSMFGWDVNKTKVEKGGFTQQEMNICTETEIKAGGECQAGIEGSAPGQFEQPYSVAVDHASGDVYVAERLEGPGTLGERVQKFTAEGRFVLEIGEEVNEKTKGNLCSREEEEKEAVKCTGPALKEYGTYVPEPGSFNFEPEHGDLLAIDHEGNLYVGDESRVQEFNANGAPNGEIPIEAGAHVGALTIDQANHLYLTYESSSNIVREFNTESKVEFGQFTVSPEEPGAVVTVRGLALDGEGHLAVLTQQNGHNRTLFGLLYEASTSNLVTAFEIPPGRENVSGIGFNENGELYVATYNSQEVLAYTPKPVAELVPGSATCVAGAEHETDVTFDCTLNGEVNPEGISETEAWFEWGRSETLGEQTSKQKVEATGPVNAVIAVRPNAEFDYRLAAEDQNAKAPETLKSGAGPFLTLLAPPNIVGDPSAPFVNASSTVMFAELNPENASTEYFFEYSASEEALAKCAGVRKPNGCPGVSSTAVSRSAVYGKIGEASEVTGLQPSTPYYYRLFAENKSASGSEKFTSTGPTGSFTTAGVATPSAVTGVYSALGATNAVVSGTVVPDGAPVVFAFELGVYDGANTQYGVVYSGTVDPNGGAVEETLPLTGLQPGTTYAYRIAISSGYINNETHALQGQTVTFTTAGLPAVLQVPPVLAQLSVPNVAFPKATSAPKTKKKSKGKAKKHRKGKTKKHRKGKAKKR